MQVFSKEMGTENFSRCAINGDSMRKIASKPFVVMMVLSLLSLGLMLAGCGGSGSKQMSSQVVSGTAAVGAPLSGQVSLKDSSMPAMQRATVIGSDGSFAIDVTNLKA